MSLNVGDRLAVSETSAPSVILQGKMTPPPKQSVGGGFTDFILYYFDSTPSVLKMKLTLLSIPSAAPLYVL